MREPMVRIRPMAAWLILWEWIGDHAAVESPIVDIVSARKDDKYIKDYLQRLHDVKCLSLEERAATARFRNPHAPPYEPKLVFPVGYRGEYHCGHNPNYEPHSRRRWPERRRIRNDYIPQIAQTVEFTVHRLLRSFQHSQQTSHLFDDIALVAYHQ